jgi:hypothetical protein
VLAVVWFGWQKSVERIAAYARMESKDEMRIAWPGSQEPEAHRE